MLIKKNLNINYKIEMAGRSDQNRDLIGSDRNRIVEKKKDRSADRDPAPREKKRRFKRILTHF